jgi:hypothetical protein
VLYSYIDAGMNPSHFHFVAVIIAALAVFANGRLVISPYIVTRFDDFPILDLETGIPYTNCGGSESSIQRVDISPCQVSNGDTCVIQRGSNVTFEMPFVSRKNTQTLEAKIYGVKDYIPIPLPCPQVISSLKACKSHYFRVGIIVFFLSSS